MSGGGTTAFVVSRRALSFTVVSRTTFAARLRGVGVAAGFTESAAGTVAALRMRSIYGITGAATVREIEPIVLEISRAVPLGWRAPNQCRPYTKSPSTNTVGRNRPRLLGMPIGFATGTPRAADVDAVVARSVARGWG